MNKYKNFTQDMVNSIDKTTEDGFAEALLTAMTGLKDKQGLLLNIRMSKDMGDNIDFAKQIARMMLNKEKNT